ncbi:hypothetical protein [Pseudogemmobacter blasticus]|uniref:hypothetical protein n=1 Tax=Fuscovulum blasticum TaxID=1075 RepID=UPI0011B23E90|nr:hypothetical protein [Fuscovulum blasticum]
MKLRREGNRLPRRQAKSLQSCPVLTPAFAAERALQKFATQIREILQTFRQSRQLFPVTLLRTPRLVT